MLTIVILSYNTEKLLKDCLESIFDKKWRNKLDVWVVDNDSKDGSLEMVKKNFPQVSIIANKDNLGFAKGNNQILTTTKNEYCLLLNSDTLVLEGSLDNLVDFMDNSDFGIGTCKLLNKDKTLQPNAGDLPFGAALLFWLSGLDDIFKGLSSFHINNPNYYKGDKQVGWIGGTAMIVKKKVVDKMGGLDEHFFMYAEDVEFCLRAKKNGFKVGWTDKAEIIHLGGGSSKNPALRQWSGEFKGLIYIYKKYLGIMSAIYLRILIYFFTSLRILAFSVLGRFQIAQTYVKVLFSF